MKLYINVTRVKKEGLVSLIDFYGETKGSHYENNMNEKEIIEVINTLRELADKLSIEAYNAYGIE